jgi:hypothetical protein
MLCCKAVYRGRLWRPVLILESHLVQQSLGTSALFPSYVFVIIIIPYIFVTIIIVPHVPEHFLQNIPCDQGHLLYLSCLYHYTYYYVYIRCNIWVEKVCCNPHLYLCMYFLLHRCRYIFMMRVLDAFCQD